MDQGRQAPGAPAVPAAQQRRKRFWFDPRFAIGLTLVGVSVVGAVALFSATDASSEVLAARSALAPGQKITSGDLVAVKVRVAAADRLYLHERDVPDAGVVVTRAVAAGELVPTAAIGSVAGLQLASVVLSLEQKLPASVGAGSNVDVWAAPAVEGGSFGPPIVIVSSAIVVKVSNDSALVAGSASTAVEVLVPRFATARVLEAIANKAAITVVPVDLPLGQ
ncbi:MAG: hypothetical protein JWR53_1907 [Glaciihabitans sp.]|nr:hypothetical protein [Glaciihabitans sp.]